MKRWSVYILINPKTFHVFYVGCTKNLLGRKSGHLFENCKKTPAPTPKDKYIIQMGCDPIMVTIDHVFCGSQEPCKYKTPIRALRAEAYWINQFRGVGYDIMNTELFKSNRLEILEGGLAEG